MTSIVQDGSNTSPKVATTAPPLLQAEIDAGISAATYSTITDVEIAFVGMEWPASTGPVTLTFEHLSDAMAAANDDPHILPPRAKIGHTDPRFNEGEPVHDAFEYHGMIREDGTPAYGRFVNLRLENDGASLRGDWIEVPSWLADAAPSAYPTRSLEGDWDVETTGGKRYSFVVTAVALGGVWLPAISCLEDLVRELTGGPEAARKPVQAKGVPMPVDASASIDAVKRTFWNDFAQGDRYWWWPVDVWIDPNQVIADDDEGHLFRVPFTTDSDGNVTFDDPVRVMQEFRDLPELTASMKGQLVVRFATAEMARPPDRVRAANDNEGDPMTDEERKARALELGLPEDATEDDIKAAETENETAPEPEAETENETAPEPELKGDTVQVSREVWNQTNARLSSLEATNLERTQKDDNARRDSKIAAAMSSGRIAATEHDHYRGLMDIDEDKTSALLSALEPGRVPVDEHALVPNPDGVDAAAHQSVMSTVFGVSPRKES